MHYSHQGPDMAFLEGTLLEMLAIPCPTGFTDGIVRYVSEHLDAMGVSHELTRRGTIRATIKGKQSSPDRAIAAHLDTIGAMVRGIKPNGRLELAPIGHWSSRFAEGSRVSIFGDHGCLRGSVLPLMASGHAYNEGVDNLPVNWDTVELRIDAVTTSYAETVALGIHAGDFVAFDPLPEFTENGYISSRHLDNKAGAAALLAAIKHIMESGDELPIDLHPIFTITEETGTGSAGALPWDVSEFVGVDIAPSAPGQSTSEHAVTLCMQDSGGPYDYHLTRHLLSLCHRDEIPVRRDLFRYYHSDAEAAIRSGNDTRTALVAFGTDATHGYERTHRDSLEAITRLLTAYAYSPPVFEDDKCHDAPLENFQRQLSPDAISASDTPLPPLERAYAHESFNGELKGIKNVQNSKKTKKPKK
ncbi:MAG TPA: osmoprotectant NAGGN system M42 family peptidase [Pseudomonas xinjiangensis]|uniref:Osmoprotectant NAGGN system M42 family peptidase n=2 Tax=root TaxID=1 RepID=A0A7V1BN64_9GAMM|nr:osmoprotectant NAGGN system M42 family peptidase [Halopseudomonas xinjiangensis]HEC46098.1 osmoprotectant NAGGN system M42 family peptidase [Halopseudomonas xinjiangensis]